MRTRQPNGDDMLINGVESLRDANIARLKMVHFHHTDGRFCGTSEQASKFSFDLNAVTCSHCKGRDTFALSPRAAQWVESES